MDKEKKEISSKTKSPKKRKVDSLETETTTIISENWKKLQQNLPKSKKRKVENEESEENIQVTEEITETYNEDEHKLTKYIALDCEMVGAEDGTSLLARVVIINSYGNMVYDKYVLPQEKVADLRTRWSGIRKQHLHPEIAFPFKEVQQEVADIIKGRIVVGHSLENDFRSLFLSHPFTSMRDTAKFRKFQRSKGKPRKLKWLAQTFLGLSIQSGEHDPCEDARTALLLYNKFKVEWESRISNRRKKKKTLLQMSKKKVVVSSKKEKKLIDQ